MYALYPCGIEETFLEFSQNRSRRVIRLLPSDPSLMAVYVTIYIHRLQTDRKQSFHYDMHILGPLILIKTSLEVSKGYPK